MANFTHRQDKSPGSPNATSNSATFNSPTAANALVLVSVSAFVWTVVPTSLTITDNFGNTYTTTPSSGVSISSIAMWLGYFIFPTAKASQTTVTATFNDGTLGTGATDISITEFNFTLPAYAVAPVLDADGSGFDNSGTVSNVVTPLVQASSSHELLYSLVRCFQPPTAHSPWTQFFGNPDTEYILDGSAGTTSPNWTFGSPSQYVVLVASFGFQFNFQSTEVGAIDGSDHWLGGDWR